MKSYVVCMGNYQTSVREWIILIMMDVQTSNYVPHLKGREILFLVGIRFVHPKHTLKIIGKEIFTILRWKYFVSLNLCWDTFIFITYFFTYFITVFLRSAATVAVVMATVQHLRTAVTAQRGHLRWTRRALACSPASLSFKTHQCPPCLYPTQLSSLRKCTDV